MSQRWRPGEKQAAGSEISSLASVLPFDFPPCLVSMGIGDMHGVCVCVSCTSVCLGKKAWVRMNSLEKMVICVKLQEASRVEFLGYWAEGEMSLLN